MQYSLLNDKNIRKKHEDRLKKKRDIGYDQRKTTVIHGLHSPLGDEW